MNIAIIVLVAFMVCFLLFLISGIRIVRPFEVGVTETLGKFSRRATGGFHWIVPFIQKMYYVNMTEQMVDIEPQKIMTKDKLNMIVDGVVYFKIKDAKSALYNVDNHEEQLIALASTTLRAVLGKMTLTQCNEERGKINVDVEAVLDKETNSYGVEVLRVEIQRIEPPDNVESAMNQVVVAEQKKIAAKDQAEAQKIEASGFKFAEIEKAQGEAEAIKLRASADAEAIKKVNDARAESFKDGAVEQERITAMAEALKVNKTFILSDEILKSFGGLINKLGAKQ